MSARLTYRVLGNPGEDNALFVRIDGGKRISRLLFDCGESCAASLGMDELLGLDAVFFSHLHMDHVAGFDTYVRARYGQPKANHLYGPVGTGRILQHRLQGYLWNLAAVESSSWWIHDVKGALLHSVRLSGTDHFSEVMECKTTLRSGPLLDHPDFTVEEIQLDHRTTSLGFKLQQKPRTNINPEALAALSLSPGPWLKRLTEETTSEDSTTVLAQHRTVAELRALLLEVTLGKSIAYLTDFRLWPETLEALGKFLQGSDVILCETQYLSQDAALAEKHYHLTAMQAAQIARVAGAKRLELIHQSSRYLPTQLPQFLEEARSIFPETYFPSAWSSAEVPAPDGGETSRPGTCVGRENGVRV